MEFAIIAEDPNTRLKDPLWDHVVSALNIQASQHVAKAWSTEATVASYPDAASVPATAVPVVVMQKPDNGVEGCHQWANGRASAVVRWAPNGAWSVAASHEIVETLVDPSLAVMRPGPDPRGGDIGVSFLLEACDPCAGTTYPASPGSPIMVSDFCLPAYYAKNSFAPFTFCNQSIHLWTLDSLVSISGYATWVDGTDWYQYYLGTTHGPFSATQVLSNAMLTGNRGAVDRFGKFAKHEYSRVKKAGAKARAVSGAEGQIGGARGRAPVNKALVEWVRGLRK